MLTASPAFNTASTNCQQTLTLNNSENQSITIVIPAEPSTDSEQLPNSAEYTDLISQAILNIPDMQLAMTEDGEFYRLCSSSYNSCAYQSSYEYISLLVLFIFALETSAGIEDIQNATEKHSYAMSSMQLPVAQIILNGFDENHLLRSALTVEELPIAAIPIVNDGGDRNDNIGMTENSMESSSPASSSAISSQNKGMDSLVTKKDLDDMDISMVGLIRKEINNALNTFFNKECEKEFEDIRNITMKSVPALDLSDAIPL
ncbi:hypothetical protein QAD02_012486 [Eretmocerus hayati]|uniref:Uncharacterized protein n=1 Tax=Eretmocerus hayati TaxID=131215 RepID=A0ACC2P2D9_9HYME|nr:hypothetical protein QAD02_012486 [Eretmocerus hayati]